MKYQQRDLVFVKDEMLPDGNALDHPFLIISCRAANSKESHYTAIMMTGSAYRDNFTFVVDNDMFEAPLKKANCQFRLYILTSLPESRIDKWMNRMKPFYFKQVITRIKDFVLAVDTN